MGLVTIVTGTYNKASYLRECAASVIAQTHERWQWRLVLDGPDEATRRVAADLCDPRIAVVELSTTDEERAATYRPAAICNEEFDRAAGTHVIWLSDDDLWRPTFLAKLLACGVPVAYCSTRRTRGGRCYAVNRASRPVGAGTGIGPDCLVDGGSVLITKEVWREMRWHHPTNWLHASHVDGIMLTELARRHTFHPVDEELLEHRATPLSTHER